MIADTAFCRRCGALPSYPCVTRRGLRAAYPHTVRVHSWNRAAMAYERLFHAH